MNDHELARLNRTNTLGEELKNDFHVCVDVLRFIYNTQAGEELNNNFYIYLDAVRFFYNTEIDNRKQLVRQRDEARREVCNWSVGVGLKATSQEVAEHRGWDCYKEAK